MTNPVRVETHIEGADAMVRDLLALNANVKKTEVGAVRAGGRLIANAANVNASTLSSKSGRKVSLRVRRRKGYTVGSIFPAKGFAHLRLFEYGTGAGWRWARKGGPFTFWAGNRLVVTRAIQHPGLIARPWLRPAFDAQSQAAVDALGKVFADAVEAARIAAEGSDD